MSFVAASVLLLLAAPRIVAPGERSQTTREAVRIYAEVAPPASVSVQGQRVADCETGGKRAALAHCTVPLQPGENKVSVSDASGSAEITVLRYVTTGRLLPGVETTGFGEGTVHRAEVEGRCAQCHDMNEAQARAQDQPLLGTQCASCHADLVSRPRQHGPVGQGVCLMCHDAASSPQRYAVAWPIQNTCFRCHGDIQQAMIAKAYRHGPTAAGRCTTCHDPHGSPNVFWLKKPVWDLCTNCHTEKASDRHVVVGFVYGDTHPMRGRPHPVKPGVEFACSGCHNPHAAQARYLWQFDATKREDLCRTCHAK